MDGDRDTDGSVESYAEEAQDNTYKIKCQACFIRIGKTYIENEVFYDRLKERWVCGGCARWDLAEVDRYEKIANVQEISDLSIGELRKLLLARTKEICTPERFLV